MSSPATGEEFSDLQSHKQMWAGFTHLLVRSIIGLVILLLFIGWVTGVL
jgi:hypothetical protein